MAVDAIFAGAIAMASLTIALFFLRFWKTTHDRFFLFFALSFVLEAVSRLLYLTHPQQADDPVIYGIRLVAYVLILIAVVDKNRQTRR